MGVESRLNPDSRENTPKREGVIDLRGRPLQVGDEVLLNVQNPIFFRVVDIGPVLDPKLPPGLLQIQVGVATHWYAESGRINPQFIRVRTAEEAGPMNMVKLDDTGSSVEEK